MDENPAPAGTGRKRKKLRRLHLLRYHQGDSFMHRLDPRTKLAMLIALSAIALIFSSLPALLIVFVFEVMMAVSSGLGRKFFRALTLFLPLVILVLILDSLFTKAGSGQVWFAAEIWILHPEITTGSILFAVAMGLRLLVLLGISTLFLMTTNPDDFVRSLKSIRIPSTITFSLGYALHSTTALADETRQIMDAQRSRGLELDRGNIIKNRNKFTALFIPVTVTLLKRSKNTADAMQARGFRQGMRHSCYHSPKPGREDLLAGIAFGLLIVILVLMTWYFR